MPTNDIRGPQQPTDAAHTTQTTPVRHRRTVPSLRSVAVFASGTALLVAACGGGVQGQLALNDDTTRAEVASAAQPEIRTNLVDPHRLPHLPRSAHDSGEKLVPRTERSPVDRPSSVWGGSYDPGEKRVPRTGTDTPASAQGEASPTGSPEFGAYEGPGSNSLAP